MADLLQIFVTENQDHSDGWDNHSNSCNNFATCEHIQTVYFLQKYVGTHGLILLKLSNFVR